MSNLKEGSFSPQDFNNGQSVGVTKETPAEVKGDKVELNGGSPISKEIIPPNTSDNVPQAAPGAFNKDGNSIAGEVIKKQEPVQNSNNNPSTVLTPNEDNEDNNGDDLNTSSSFWGGWGGFGGFGYRYPYWNYGGWRRGFGYGGFGGYYPYYGGYGGYGGYGRSWGRRWGWY